MPTRILPDRHTRNPATPSHITAGRPGTKRFTCCGGCPNGDAEIGFTQISEILPYAGAEVAGPLPAEIQLYTSFSTGIGAKANDPGAAKAFVEFMATPSAAAVLKAKGLDPR